MINNEFQQKIYENGTSIITKENENYKFSASFIFFLDHPDSNRGLGLFI